MERIRTPGGPRGQGAGAARAELRRASRKWRKINLMRLATGGTATASTLTMLASNINAVKTYADVVRSFVASYGLALVLGLCVGLFLLAELVQLYILDDHAEGRYVASGEERNR